MCGGSEDEGGKGGGEAGVLMVGVGVDRVGGGGGGGGGRGVGVQGRGGAVDNHHCQITTT